MAHRRRRSTRPTRRYYGRFRHGSDGGFGCVFGLLMLVFSMLLSSEPGVAAIGWGIIGFFFIFTSIL